MFWKDALKKLQEAYLALLDGGVKSYKIGNEELTRLDLVSLMKRIEEAEKKVDELEALLESGHARRAFAVTPGWSPPPGQRLQRGRGQSHQEGAEGL